MSWLKPESDSLKSGSWNRAEAHHVHANLNPLLGCWPWQACCVSDGCSRALICPSSPSLSLIRSRKFKLGQGGVKAWLELRQDKQSATTMTYCNRRHVNHVAATQSTLLSQSPSAFRQLLSTHKLRYFPLTKPSGQSIQVCAGVKF